VAAAQHQWRIKAACKTRLFCLQQSQKTAGVALAASRPHYRTSGSIALSGSGGMVAAAWRAEYREKPQQPLQNARAGPAISAMALRRTAKPEQRLAKNLSRIAALWCAKRAYAHQSGGRG